MIKFVLNKINLTCHSAKLIVIFCCIFELTGWDVCFIIRRHSTMFRSLKLVVGTYGWRHSGVQCKKQHTFLTRTMKSQKNAILLSDGTIFFIHSKYWQVSKYTLFFPKKGKNKSKLSETWNQGFRGAMRNYTFENLNSFFHQTNEIILN